MHCRGRRGQVLLRCPHDATAGTSYLYCARDRWPASNARRILGCQLGKEFTMVLWGAICGAVLAALWPGHAGDVRILVGVALGALAGWGLQRAVRRELRAALAGHAT